MRGLLVAMLLVTACCDEDRTLTPLWKYTCQVKGWCDNQPYTAHAVVCAEDPTDGADQALNYIVTRCDASYDVSIDCTLMPLYARFCLF